MLKKRIGLLALVTSSLACWPASADEFRLPAVAADRPADTDRSVSLSCVLLQNDNVLFGHASQVGEFVVVRTGQGGEVQLPRKDVVCWADSLRNLYRYRVDHRQKGDITAHVRDARWCVQHDLYDLAATEIRIINQLDPGNVKAKLVEDQLQRLTAPRSAAYPSLVAPPSAVQPAGFIDQSPELGTIDIPTLRRFASHVQPMLFNRCGRCHARRFNRGWTLSVPLGGARASSRMTRENLAASIRYINRSAPEESDLLVKATSPHGGGPAPLDPRNAKAIRSLKYWLANARYGSPRQHLDDHVAEHNISERVDPTDTPLIADHGVTVDDAGASEDRSDQPARLPEVANPFDPDLFNRRFHPESSSQ